MFVFVSALGSHICGRILMKIYREVQGHPRKVLGPKKILTRTHPGVQGQKRVKGLGLGLELFYLFVFIPFYPGQRRVLQLVANKS